MNPRNSNRRSSVGNSTTEPASRKCTLGVADRVILDVGGSKFTSAVTTLSSNSAYFAALFSAHWNTNGNDDHDENNNNDTATTDTTAFDEIFLDQDPRAFGKLLAYMRQGMINATDIDKNVLLLAEFLGVEHLLLAVRVRAYRNLHPRLAPMNDQQIASWFDKKYGGIREALSSGVLPGSLTQHMEMQQEFAIMDLEPEGSNTNTRHDHINISIDINRSQQPDLESIHIIGALNWLNHHGYIKHEAQLNTECRSGKTMTFSRIKPLYKNNPSADDIFMPENKFHAAKTSEQSWRKQFAMLLMDKSTSRFIVHAPSQFHHRTDEHGNLSATAIVEEDGTWLERNRFVDREVALEELFRPWLGNGRVMEMHFPTSSSDLVSYRIYSRKIECLHRGEMRYVET
jgi:hypothetical protein